MNRENRLNDLNLCSFALLSIILTSCFSPRTIIRDYQAALPDSCDCYTKYPVIPIGFKSVYYRPEKAFCTRSNYLSRRDSVSGLEVLNMQIFGSDRSEDSVGREMALNDSLIRELKKEWTHARIKTKFRGTAEETIIFKQKTRYYNKFRFWRKRVGMKKYKNGTLVKSKMKG